MHVIVCHSSSLIRWNRVNHHTLVHPYHVSLFSILVMPWTVVYAFINLFFYQSLMLTVISKASHINLQEWWQMQVLFLSGKKRLCTNLDLTIHVVCLQQSSPWRLKCFLAQVERRSMYVCEYVWVIIIVLPFHNEMEKACVWDWERG